jgi:hypothetical protein
MELMPHGSLQTILDSGWKIWVRAESAPPPPPSRPATIRAPTYNAWSKIQECGGTELLIRIFCVALCSHALVLIQSIQTALDRSSTISRQADGAASCHSCRLGGGNAAMRSCFKRQGLSVATACASADAIATSIGSVPINADMVRRAGGCQSAGRGREPCRAGAPGSLRDACALSGPRVPARPRLDAPGHQERQSAAWARWRGEARRPGLRCTPGQGAAEQVRACIPQDAPQVSFHTSISLSL